MTSQILSLQQIDDIARRALSACGAVGQQLEIAVQLDRLEVFAASAGSV